MIPRSIQARSCAPFSGSLPGIRAQVKLKTSSIFCLGHYRRCGLSIAAIVKFNVSGPLPSILGLQGCVMSAAGILRLMRRTGVYGGWNANPTHSPAARVIEAIQDREPMRATRGSRIEHARQCMSLTANRSQLLGLVHGPAPPSSYSASMTFSFCPEADCSARDCAAWR